MLVDAGSGVATLGIPSCAGVLPSSASDTLTAQYNSIDSVNALFKAHHGDVAAVIVEPVVGNAGFIKPEGEFLKSLREATKKEGALLIFDEVMTGFRVGIRGAQGVYGITPDLTMLGKVIGGGLPVGAFGGRRDIMSLLAPLGPVYQAGTLSGNPLAMVAGLTTIKEWISGDLFERTAKGAEQIVSCLRASAKRAGIPLVADSQGAMFGFFFDPGPVRNYEEAKSADTGRFKRFFNLMLEEGVYFAPSQFEAGFISSAHLGAPLSETLAAIERVFSGGKL